MPTASHLNYQDCLARFIAVSRHYFSTPRDAQRPDQPGESIFEVVQVIGSFRLLDGLSRERSYQRRDGVPLAPGFYFVKFAPEMVGRKFGEQAVFRGPYQRRQDAGDALERFKVRITFRNRHEEGLPKRPRANPYPAAAGLLWRAGDQGTGRFGTR